MDRAKPITSAVLLDIQSALVAAFSASFVSLALCLYKSSAACVGEAIVVLLAAFCSTFVALAAAGQIRKAIYKKNSLRFFARVVSVAVLLIVFSVMYFGSIWEPPGTYFYYTRYYDQSLINVAYAYAFFFDLYAFSGVVLLGVALIGSLLKIEMKSLHESGYVYLINWFSMKIVFFIFAIPSIYTLGW